MSWLARLKKQNVLGTDATKPTEPGFVGFVASIPEPSENSQGDYGPYDDAANAAAAAPPDPNRWCWPASSAMNSGEIDIMLGRLARFTDKGLTLDEAEQMADRLVLRDRDGEGDGRRSCFECSHLVGIGASRRCGNWRAAGTAMQAGDAAIGRDFALLLQRCPGFLNVSQQQNGEAT